MTGAGAAWLGAPGRVKQEPCGMYVAVVCTPAGGTGLTENNALHSHKLR